MTCILCSVVTPGTFPISYPCCVFRLASGYSVSITLPPYIIPWQISAFTLPLPWSASWTILMANLPVNGMRLPKTARPSIRPPTNGLPFVLRSLPIFMVISAGGGWRSSLAAKSSVWCSGFASNGGAKMSAPNGWARSRPEYSLPFSIFFCYEWIFCPVPYSLRL